MSGQTVTLSSKTPTRTGFRFLEWNTAADGSGTSYAESSTIELDPEIDNGTITLYAIWGCGNNKICYDGNDADSGTMADQTSGSILRASNFSRAGYGFAGWNTEKDGSGTNYGPNENITIPSVGLQLYANWVEAAKDSSNNPVYLQGWTKCSELGAGQITALTDSRDNQVYAVAKLADGNCWLVENLRTDVANVTINNANTNHPTSSFITEATALTSASWDTCKNQNSACYDHISYGLGNINGSGAASYSGGTQNTPWYSYGVMYNWYTATAGHGTYAKTSSDGAMPGDICPSGWHLPYGGSGSGTKGGNTSGGFYYHQA